MPSKFIEEHQELTSSLAEKDKPPRTEHRKPGMFLNKLRNMFISKLAPTTSAQQPTLEL
jgi:hypothetical protein